MTKKKMVIYYLIIRNCKKLMEKLNCETFYYNVGNKKFFLKEFINKKQQIMIATSAFGIKINVADIRIIIYTNELKTILNYTQKSKQMEQVGKRNKAIIIQKQIKTKGEKKRKKKRKKRGKKTKTKNK